jgi:hypothetical protein
MHYIDSSSMLQKFLTAVISEEWAREHDAVPDAPPLIEKSVMAQTLSSKTLAWLQGAPPAAYHEMSLTLVRIHQDCIALLGAFASDCKLPMSSIPFLGTEIDVTGTKPGCFTIEVAQNAVGALYTRLKDSLGRTKKRELGVIAEKRLKIVASIERYVDVKAQHDIRVSAAFAAAFVAFRSTPDKVSPVVKGIMNGIKVSGPATIIPGTVADKKAERGQHRPPDAFGRRRRVFYRVLHAAQYLAAPGQDRQEFVHIPVPGCRADTGVCVDTQAHGGDSFVPGRQQGGDERQRGEGQGQNCGCS